MNKLTLYYNNIKDVPVGVAEPDADGIWNIFLEEDEFSVATASAVVSTFLDYITGRGGVFCIEVE